MDLFEQTRALRVVDVWQPGNETGWVTPRVLYDPTVRADDGDVKAPGKLESVSGWVDHGTVGSNTLRFWGTGGSVANRTWSLAHYLVPHDTTEYADRRAHDTRYTVFKMVPDGYGCNHTGPTFAYFGGHNTIGVEYESLQNGTHDISEQQYIKGALLYAYAAASQHIRDYFRVPHGLIAKPWTRRTDPWAGLFDIAHSWELVQQIRHDPRIWQLWGMPQPQRGY